MAGRRPIDSLPHVVNEVVSEDPRIFKTHAC